MAGSTRLPREPLPRTRGLPTGWIHDNVPTSARPSESGAIQLEVHMSTKPTTKKAAPKRAAAKAEKPAVLGCRVEGCKEPRWVLRTGHVVPRCQAHENERSKAWHAAKRLAQKSGAQPRPKGEGVAAPKGVLLPIRPAAAPKPERPHVPAELVARRKAEKAGLKVGQ